METFNKTEYNTEYRKKALKEKKKAQFNTDLFYDEKQELDELLKKENMSKADFVRLGILNIKKERGMNMNKNDIKNYLNLNKVKTQDWFDEHFALGAYSYQDQNLEENYEIEDGSVFTVVSIDHDYAYISIFDENEEQFSDGYITFEKYEELIKMITK